MSTAQRWTAAIALLLFCICGLYTLARLTRYEITQGGSQRYYVVVKLDRWTGRAWKMEAGPSWGEITEQEAPTARAPRDLGGN